MENNRGQFKARAHRVWAQRALLAGLVTAAFMVVNSRAGAAPPGPDALPITVVSVKSDDALDQAEALTQALRKAVQKSEGWSLGPGNQSLEFLALQMKCSEPIDAACEARIAEVIKADRYLWSVIELAENDKMVVGKLNFFVRGKGTSSTELRYSANLTDATADSLIEVAQKAVEEVTGGTPKGGLRVVTDGVPGQLYINDKPLGALEAEGGSFQLPAGNHRVVVKAPGYADAEKTVEVKPGTTVEVKLTMVPLKDEEGVDGRMIGGFVGLAIGVGAGAVGLWAALEVNSVRTDSSFEAYRQGFTANINACEQARAGTVVNSSGAATPGDAAEMCDKADSLELIQAVMFPIAAVAAGVGAYLLGTSSLAGGSDDEEEEKEAESAGRWNVQAAVGPQASHFWLEYSF